MNTKSSWVSEDDFDEARDAVALEAERDSCLGEIVRTDLTLDVVTRHDPDAELTEFTGKMRDNFHICF